MFQVQRTFGDSSSNKGCPAKLVSENMAEPLEAEGDSEDTRTQIDLSMGDQENNRCCADINRDGKLVGGPLPRKSQRWTGP